MTSRHRRGAEAGTSLLELIIAVAIIGIGIVAILGGLTTAIMGSQTHRGESIDEWAARNIAERVEAEPYVPCPAAAAAYSTIAQTFVDSLAPEVSARYGNPPLASAEVFSPVPGDRSITGWTTCTSDSGLQKVTIVIGPVSGTDAGMRLDLIRRDPS